MMFSVEEETNENPHGSERRKAVYLTDAQIDKIAERAADKAVEKITETVYTAIGKSFVEKALWLIGLSIAGVSMYLYNKGVIKLD